MLISSTSLPPVLFCQSLSFVVTYQVEVSLKVTLDRLLQLSNAEMPMLVTLLPITTLVRLSQLKNA